MLGIITVNYNSHEMVYDLYSDLQRQEYKDWILIIVDNNSNKKSIEQIKKKILSQANNVVLIENQENLGFAKANNIGVSYLVKKFGDVVDTLLFINPDIRINNTHYLTIALNTIEREKADFLGTEIINEDGERALPLLNQRKFLHVFLHIGNNGIIDKYINRKKEIVKLCYVFGVNGSCFFAKKNAFLKIDKFDPNTFLYYEEDILFSKAKKNNLKVCYYPYVSVIHRESKVMKKNITNYKRKCIIFQSEKYFLKNILKINVIQYIIFILERNLELFLIKYLIKFYGNGGMNE
jgi:GT2 family glycosyltransferase